MIMLVKCKRFLKFLIQIVDAILLQSECRIIMPIPQTPENLVLQAVMDEFEENRERGNLTAFILNKEKVFFMILFGILSY